MSDLTPWLLSFGAALILTGGWLVAWTATHRDEPTADIRWDDTDTMLLPWDDTAAVPVVRAALPAVTWVGWGADGWCPLAELSRLQREATGLNDETFAAWMQRAWRTRLARDLDTSPILAGVAVKFPSALAIEPRRQLELEGAPA